MKVAKGNLKISNFFNKLNKQNPKEISGTKEVKESCDNLSNKVIIVSSGDDFVDVPDKSSKNKESTLAIDANYPKNIKSSIAIPVIKKRKVKEIDTHSPPQKKT
ncbi:hypothetical protein NQ314_004986 [Rhamnusium bicolor]|uniref:Uncharacterized protein n=1 Tax=Rhamnusium bicolor TaxID=1586634 RepID=A0AAV8ZK02_9CUCU|nr:hypothetical protein NQ314_004986 [Rhamnusium bicolor]